MVTDSTAIEPAHCRTFSRRGVGLKIALNYDGQALRRFIDAFYYDLHEPLYRLENAVIAAVNDHARVEGVTW